MALFRLHTAFLLAILALPRAASGDVGTYHELPPPMRLNAMPFYDPGRDRYMVLGGDLPFSATTRWGGIWALDASLTKPWAPVPEAAPTSPFKRANLIYDPVRDRMLVSGGILANGDTTSDVWAMSLVGPATWSLVATPAGGPAGRKDMFSVYDPVGDRLVFFGGVGPHPTFGIVRWNETWDLTLAGTPAWHQLTTVGAPPAAEGMQAVFDPARRGMVIRSTSGVYALDLATLTWTNVPVTSDPVLDKPVTMVVDPQRDRFLIYGIKFRSGQVRHTEIWTAPMTGGAYTQLANGVSPVNPDVTLILDPGRSRLVLLGGREYSGGSVMDRTAIDDLATATGWVDVGPPVAGTGARSGAFVVRDPSAPRMIVVGGSLANGNIQPEAIAYDLSGDAGWTPFTENNRPFPNVQPYAFDPRRREVLGFAKDTYQSPVNYGKLWRFALATQTWSMTPTTPIAAGAINGQAAIVDSTGDRLVFFGSATDTTFHVAVAAAWSLSLADAMPTWTPIPSPNASPQPDILGFGRVAVYDPVRQRALYFGNGHPVLALDLGATPSWSSLGNLPTGFADKVVAYDPPGDRILIFFDDFNAVGEPHLWSWPLSLPPSQAVELAPGGTAPSPATAWCGGWDAEHDRWILLGGQWGVFDYVANGIPVPPGAVSVGCAEPASGLPGTTVPVTFTIADDAAGTHDYAWRIDSAQAWPGFPLTGTRTGPGPVSVGASIPDTAQAVANELVFSAYDVADDSRGSSCVTTVTPGSGGSAGALAFLASGTTVELGALDVRFRLPAAGAVHLGVYDLRGRRVASRVLDADRGGSYALRLADAGTLRPGMYFLRLEQAGQAVRGRVILLGP